MCPWTACDGEASRLPARRAPCRVRSLSLVARPFGAALLLLLALWPQLALAQGVWDPLTRSAGRGRLRPRRTEQPVLPGRGALRSADHGPQDECAARGQAFGGQAQARGAGNLHQLPEPLPAHAGQGVPGNPAHGPARGQGPFRRAGGNPHGPAFGGDQAGAQCWQARAPCPPWPAWPWRATSPWWPPHIEYRDLPPKLALWVRWRTAQKAAWAYKELKALLIYARSAGFDPASIPGSVYGAIGICQFMPTNAVRYGADLDGGRPRGPVQPHGRHL